MRGMARCRTIVESGSSNCLALLSGTFFGQTFRAIFSGTPPRRPPLAPRRYTPPASRSYGSVRRISGRISYRFSVHFTLFSGMPQDIWTPGSTGRREPHANIISSATQLVTFVNPLRRDHRVPFRNSCAPLPSPWGHTGLGGASLAQVSHKFGASSCTGAAALAYTCSQNTVRVGPTQVLRKFWRKFGISERRGCKSLRTRSIFVRGGNGRTSLPPGDCTPRGTSGAPRGTSGCLEVPRGYLGGTLGVPSGCPEKTRGAPDYPGVTPGPPRGTLGCSPPGVHPPGVGGAPHPAPRRPPSPSGDTHPPPLYRH
jgi:hypothetical protein